MSISDVGRTWSPEPESGAGVRSPAIVYICVNEREGTC